MIEQRGKEMHRLSDPAPLAMLAFALPLFVWSAFNADYFDAATQETFIIPLAVFFGAPVALLTAMWGYYHRDGYLATMAGLIGAFWASYGMLVWLTQRGVVADTTATGDIRGLLFAVWAAAFGIVWLGSMREHWAMSLVALGAGVMFAFLSYGQYAANTDLTRIGGWVGFVTAALAGYAALAELLNAELERPVLPTDLAWLTRLGHRTR